MDESFGRKPQPIPEIPEEIIKKIGSLVKDEKVKETLIDLKICSKESKDAEILENVKAYILHTMLGKYHLKSSINRFFEGINYYLLNNEFSFDEVTGMVTDFNNLLPIKDEYKDIRGTRTMSNVLGPDRAEYVNKDTEGQRYSVVDKKNAIYGKYNPIMAQAVYEFLDEPVAEILLEYRDLQHSYILSKSFLNKNQDIIKLGDLELDFDENNKIKHEEILQAIEQYVRQKVNATEEQIERVVQKVKFQYIKQETIKKLISSIDENLGNTSLVITKNETGEIIDIDISPAYDMDLSFSLGKEIADYDNSGINYYRTSKDGKFDFYSIIKEFCEIPGYKEKIEEFIQKFDNNYVSKIFEIGYKNSKIQKFKNAQDEISNTTTESEFTSNYKTYLINMVGKLKEGYKNFLQEEKIK